MESRIGYRTMEVKPLSGLVGVEIFGADLASEVDDEQFSEIRDAFHAHGVIFFREQDLTPEQHGRHLPVQVDARLAAEGVAEALLQEALWSS